MAQQQDHPIFQDINDANLAAVQQRVLADAAVLEEREGTYGDKPLIHSVHSKKPSIALWIIQHRGQHDVGAANNYGSTALHWTADSGMLQLVQALVAAGANPAALNGRGDTPLMWASYGGHTDVVAFLVRLPAVKASINHLNQYNITALTRASCYGHKPVVQLLLDAGADPTIPAGPTSPLNQAISHDHHAVVAILRHAIAEPDRASALHKARSLLGAGAASLSCLQGRLGQGQAMPQLELTTPQQQQQLHQQPYPALEDLRGHYHVLRLRQLQRQWQQLLHRWQCEAREELRSTAAFAVGVAGGEKDSGLCEELYVELLGYMLPAWADKGPEA